MLNLQVNTQLSFCIIKYISDAYPQTVTGKIKKFELREQAIDDFPELKNELEWFNKLTRCKTIIITTYTVTKQLWTGFKYYAA